METAGIRSYPSPGLLALGEDRAAAKSSIDGLNGALKDLSTYIQVLKEVEVSPPAQQATGLEQKYDPFATCPGLVRTIKDAQKHVTAFSRDFQPARTWSGVSLPQFCELMSSQSETILTARAAVLAGQTLSVPQCKAVAEAFKLLDRSLQTQQQQFLTASKVLGTFLPQLESDRAGFVSGENNITGSIRGIKTAMNLVARGPLHGYPVDQFLKQGAQIIASLGALQKTVATLTIDSTRTGGAMAKLLGVIVNVASRTQQVAAEMAKAESARSGSVLQQVDIEVARADWQDLADYARDSGL